MNNKQRKVATNFILLISILLLTVTGVLSYAVYRNQLLCKGDIFEQVSAELKMNETMIWVPPVLVILVGTILAALVFFIGLWQINKRTKSPDTILNDQEIT
ncbi:MAG: hypothetical protein NT178_17950 [Proteobacteria bacterium]|nr:hypothetical protein [Pseudomonadota bacterium]